MAPDDLGAAGSGIDKSFDRYARMVRRMIDVPVSMVSLVERDRQVFVGAEGLPDELERTRETPLTHSFCQYVVDDGAPVVLNDARLDERGRHNLAIPDMGVVAYAGYPIPSQYDSMIAKLITYGTNRRDAMNKMNRALHEYIITGIKTTIPFKKAVLHDPEFCRGVYSTNFVEELLGGGRRELIQEKA